MDIVDGGTRHLSRQISAHPVALLFVHCPFSLLAFGLPPEEIDYESLPSNASFSSHLVEGALAGITEHSITYPFDTIKVSVHFFDLSFLNGKFKCEFHLIHRNSHCKLPIFIF